MEVHPQPFIIGLLVLFCIVMLPNTPEKDDDDT
jgi:hypothetical protein